MAACKSGNAFNDPAGKVDPAINALIKEINLTGVSYLISEDDKIIDQKFDDGNEFDQRFYQSIMRQITAPILLDKMLNDSLLNEDALLKRYLPDIADKKISTSNLLFVPANLEFVQVTNDRVRFKLIDALIKTAKKKKGYIDIDSFQHKIISKDPVNIESFLHDLLRISGYFNATHLEYGKQDPNIHSLYPTWYTKNLISFFGWRIFKFQKQTILWNHFLTNGNGVFLLKIPDRNIFIAICYKLSGNESLAFDRDDLLQSPLGTTIVKALLVPDKYQSLNYQNIISLENQLERSKGTPFHLLLTKDIIAHAEYYEHSGARSGSLKLLSLYRRTLNDTMLVSYVKKRPIAQINYISDNLNAAVPFQLKTNTNVQVFGGGQAMIKTNYSGQPDQYDNLQLFFSKNTDSALIRPGETELMQFSYRFNKVFGFLNEKFKPDWLVSSRIQFAFSDPVDSAYIMEVKIPWNTLGIKPSRKTNSLGFNVFIGDSDLDEDSRETILSWSVKPGEIWDDPNKFGVISLKNKIIHSKKKVAYSKRVVSLPPLIDGLIDPIWNTVPYNPININNYGSPSIADNSGMFKTLHDSENLYFLFYISDNCKNTPGIVTKDKAWIEDANSGEVIWKMTGKNTKYMPSFYVNQRIYLKAGKYRLRYSSDGGHSQEGWYGPIPENDIYGIQLYNAN